MSNGTSITNKTGIKAPDGASYDNAQCAPAEKKSVKKPVKQKVAPRVQVNVLEQKAKAFLRSLRVKKSVPWFAYLLPGAGCGHIPSIHTCHISQEAVVLLDDPERGEDAVVVDCVNAREFLKLNFTSPYTYSEIVNETGAEGVFAGWRVASTSELVELGMSAGIADCSGNPEQVAKAEKIRNWFCNSCVQQEGATILYGLTKDTQSQDGEIFQSTFGIGSYVDEVTGTPTVFWTRGGYDREDNQTMETFLVRDMPYLQEW